MKYLLLLLCFWTGLPSVSAQIYVQLERAGTLKTTRFTSGDVLTFQLRNDDTGWNERMIHSIDVERNRINFGDVIVHVDSITAIRFEGRSLAPVILGTALQVGGVNLMLYVGYDAIFRDSKLDWTAMGFGVLNIAAGTAIKRVFKYKIFKPGPYKRIRLLDLNFAPVKPNP